MDAVSFQSVSFKESTNIAFISVSPLKNITGLKDLHDGICSQIVLEVRDCSHLTTMMWDLMSSGIGAAPIPDIKKMGCIVTNATVHTWQKIWDLTTYNFHVVVAKCIGVRLVEGILILLTTSYFHWKSISRRVLFAEHNGLNVVQTTDLHCKK